MKCQQRLKGCQQRLKEMPAASEKCQQRLKNASSV
jgi:hypothetical protein